MTFSAPANSASSSTSSSLLQRIRLHDPEAWVNFTRVYGPLAYGWCRASGLQPADVADVVQDVFQSVAEGIHAFRRDTAGHTFRGWLWTITRNKVRDHFRSRAIDQASTGGTDAYQALQQVPEKPPAVQLPPADSADAGVTRRALEVVRGEFEDRTWQAFWQTTVEDRRPADVAADLGMTLAGVYQAKSRVLRRLRQELEGLID